jgi:hypothetical protein
MIKRAALLLAALFLAGCPKAEPLAPAPATDIAFKIDAKEAYARILRSIVEADLTVELKDVDGGIVQTEWHASERKVLAFGAEYERRIRFKIIANEGVCRVKSQTETRVKSLSGEPWGPWGDGKGVTAKEQDVHKALVGFLTKRLEDAAPAGASAPTPSPTATP